MSSVHDREIDAQVDLLFRREDGRLRHFLQLAGADRAAAEDVAQEAFLATYRTMQRDGPMDGVRARQYLYKVATYDLRRRRRRDRLRLVAQSVALAREVLFAFDETTVDDGIDRTCLAVLETLAPRQREAFLLRVVAEMFPTEIAEVMQIEVSAVKTHLDRARRKIAAYTSTNGREETS